MTLPTWPTSLPDLRGLSASAGSDEIAHAARVTEMDDGPNRSRNTTIFDVTPLAMALELNWTTFPTFRSFYRDTLSKGARRFTAPVLAPNGTIQTRTCRINGKVSFRIAGRVVPVVSFRLDVWDW